MRCPKCGEELIHLSGRYLCSDCGNEVIESEINTGSWNFSEEKSEETALGSSQLSSFDKQTVEDDDYIVGYTPEVNVGEDGIVTKESEGVETTIVPTENPTPPVQENEKGFYTSENINITSNEPVVNPDKEAEIGDVSLESPAVCVPKKPGDDFSVELETEDNCAPVSIAPIDAELLKNPDLEDDIEVPIQNQNKKGASSGSKKVIFLIVAVLFVLVATGGGIFATVNYLQKPVDPVVTDGNGQKDSSWIEFTNTENGFGIVLPGRPKSGKTTLKIDGEDLSTTVFEANGSDSSQYRVYVVALSEKLIALDKDDSAALFAKDIALKDNLVLGTQVEVDVDTNFGLDFEASSDSQILRSRLVRIDNRIFILSIKSPKDASVEEQYQNYIRSFKLN